MCCWSVYWWHDAHPALLPHYSTVLFRLLLLTLYRACSLLHYFYCCSSSIHHRSNWTGGEQGSCYDDIALHSITSHLSTTNIGPSSAPNGPMHSVQLASAPFLQLCSTRKLPLQISINAVTEPRLSRVQGSRHIDKSLVGLGRIKGHKMSLMLFYFWGHILWWLLKGNTDSPTAWVASGCWSAAVGSRLGMIKKRPNDAQKKINKSSLDPSLICSSEY